MSEAKVNRAARDAPVIEPELSDWLIDGLRIVSESSGVWVKLDGSEIVGIRFARAE